MKKIILALAFVAICTGFTAAQKSQPSNPRTGIDAAQQKVGDLLIFRDGTMQKGQLKSCEYKSGSSAGMERKNPSGKKRPSDDR